MGYDSIDRILRNTDRLVILDGATGTEIYRRGEKSYGLPWSLAGLLYDCEVVRQIHYDYFRAGANIVTANTFYTTSRALESVRGLNLPDPGRIAKTLTYLAVLIAREAERLASQSGPGRPTCVAGNVAPLELDDPYDPTTVPLKTLAIREHGEKIRNLISTSVDFILIETMTTLYEAEAVLDAVQEIKPKIPIWIAFSCAKNGKLHSGENMRDVVDLVSSRSVTPCALLVNCTQPEDTRTAIDELYRLSPPMPLGAYPNVEAPVYVLEETHRRSATFDRRRDILTPHKFVECCKEWADKVRILGGCCGTTPADIKAAVEAFSDRI